MTAAKGLGIYHQTQAQTTDELVRQHAPLVKKIALHLKARLPASVQFDDLMQAGMIGLLEASRKYDPSLGAAFETYAGIRIRGAIVDEVRKGDWVPRSVHRQSRRIAAAVHQVEMRLGREAQDAEVIAHLGISADAYYQGLEDANSGHLFSLDELTDAGEIPFQPEALSSDPYAAIQSEDFKASLASAIGDLPEREQLVLALYYQESLNLKEIGAVLGVSESRVSQLHAQAALRLRARLTAWQDAADESLA